MTKTAPLLATPSAARIVLLLLLAGVFTLMVLPAGVIGFLRAQFAWVDGLADILNGTVPGGDLDHLAAFAILGVGIWLAFPKVRAWRLALILLVIGGLSELMQLWVPSRRPEIWHVMLDVFGGLAGFGTAWLLKYASGVEQGPAR